MTQVTIKAKAYVQINPETGQKNVCLTQDPITPDEDFVVYGEGWNKGDLHVGPVTIIGPKKVIEGMLDTELRGVDNVNPDGSEAHPLPSPAEIVDQLDEMKGTKWSGS